MTGLVYPVLAHALSVRFACRYICTHCGYVPSNHAYLAALRQHYNYPCFYNNFLSARCIYICRQVERCPEVYEIPCKDCPEVYVGETKGTLKVSLSEHRQVVKRGDPKNGIAVHVQKTNHCVNWEGATVQRRAEGFWPRRSVEAIQIRKATSNMNLDSSLLLPMVWNPILNPHPLSHTAPLCF